MSMFSPDGDTGIAVLDETETRICPLWKVVIHNDEQTDALFVIEILIKRFNYDAHEAMQITMDIHMNGSGVVATLPKETAEFKMEQVISEARTQKYPLQVTIEPDE